MIRIGAYISDLQLSKSVERFLADYFDNPEDYQWVDLSESEAVSAPQSPEPLGLLIVEHTPSLNLQSLLLKHPSSASILLAPADAEVLAPELVTDLCSVPVDKNTFLQKLEYILNEGKSVSPRFLYRATTRLPIELGKIARLTHLSETGLIFESKHQLQSGTSGSITAPSLSSQSRLHFKVVESIPNIDFQMGLAKTISVKKNAVHVSFFGLKQADLKEIRSLLFSLRPDYQKELQIERSTQDDPHSATDIRLTLLSPRSDLETRLQSTLDGLTTLNCTRFPNLSSFKRHLFRTHSPTQASDSAANTIPSDPDPLTFVGPLTQEDLEPALPASAIAFVYTEGEDDLKDIELVGPKVKTLNRIFGRPIEDWQRGLEPLLAGLSEASQEAFYESLDITKNMSGKKLTRIELPFRLSALRHLHIELSIESLRVVSDPESGATQASFRIAISEVDPHQNKHFEKQRKTELKPSDLGENENESNNRVDGVVIDASLLRGDPETRVKSVTEWLTANRVENRFGRLPPIVVVEAIEGLDRAEQYRNTAVTQFFYSFSDRRFEAESFLALSNPSLWIARLIRIHPVEIPESVSGLLRQVTLLRPSLALGLSEVSIVISEKKPLLKGTRLKVGLTTDAGQPLYLWARVRRAELNSEGRFENELIFEMPTDEFQRWARSYLREQYAKEKSKGA